MSNGGEFITDPDEIAFLHAARALSSEARAELLRMMRAMVERWSAGELRIAVRRYAHAAGIDETAALNMVGSRLGPRAAD